MLWKKESSRPNALYVNIFAKEGKKGSSDRLKFSPVSHKNDAIALRARKEGNRLFGTNEWTAAMEKYNQSLRFAKRGSENIALAYANRSSCFLHLELFNECLADIELAKKAGYPDHLMPKLDKRSAECLERIQQGAKPNEFGLKLTLDPDETFPCMANVLKFQQGADGSCVVVAKEDIAVGQTIVVEKAFSSFLFKRLGLKCNICLKTNCNLIPCEDCTDAMFCSRECQERLHHKYECNSKIVDIVENEINNTAMYNMRLNLQIIDMFPTADEMMVFVEQAIKRDRNELPDKLTDEKSRYRAYLKLPLDPKVELSDNFDAETHDVYILMRKMPKIQSMFASEKHNRFLMHFVMMNALVLIGHSSHSGAQINFGRVEMVSSQTYLLKRYFKHSCAANACWVERDGHSVITTILPIKKGEQLFYNAIGVFSFSKGERQDLLRSKNVTCKCCRCKGVYAVPEHRQQLAMNPEYLRIVSLLSTKVYDNKELVALANLCAVFLQKYGRIKWCDEIQKVVSAYAKLLSLQSADIKLSAKTSVNLATVFY